MLKKHEEQINAVVQTVKNKKNINHFYFVACGGSKALFQPAEYIYNLETEIPATIYSSNDFVHNLPKALNKDSVVITCSHSGNTPETVRATEVAREKGALTICLSNLEDSPLWKAAELPVHYSHREDEAPEENNRMMLFYIIFNILNILAPSERYERALKCIPSLPAVYERNVKAHEETAIKFGKTMRDEKLIYTMGSGGCYGVAYSFAICLMMEMQWINASAIHSGEYFHGPFEVTDADIPFVIIKGIDQTRPLDERAYNFCKKYSNKITLIDAADFDMEGIDEDLCGYFAPLVVDTVLGGYARQLSDFRGHPLSVRRYMWRMEY